MHTHALALVPMYNTHPYFSLKNLDKKLHIIHDKIQYFLMLKLIIYTLSKDYVKQTSIIKEYENLYFMA